MVNSEWTFTVTHYDKDDSWDDTDISADAFPRMFTDTGAGKVNAAKIRIIAQNGQYIQGDPEVNSKPQIKHNDRIRIEATDGASGTYNKVFDVIKLTPIKSKGEGVMLDVELLGLERWLQKMNYSTRVWQKTPREIFADLVKVYREQVAIATDTPTINLSSGSDPSTITVNELPTEIVLSLDWGNNEDTIFNRMTELLDAMAGPQASGGVLDFFDMRITYPTDNVTSFNISIFPSGASSSTMGSKPSITLNSTDINTEDTAGGFEEPQGLLINSWGSAGAGSLPTNYSKWSSKQVIMPTSTGSQTQFPEWSSSFEYTIGAVVKYTDGGDPDAGTDNVYKAKRTTVGDQPDSSTDDWDEIGINDYYTTSTAYNDGVVYSPWTNSVGGKDVWEASMANPSGDTGYSGFGRSMWDANIIVNDGGGNSGGAWRTWADVIATSPSTVTSSKTAWLYDGDTLYDGLRVFVKGTGSGDFSSYSNSIVEYDGDTSSWILKYGLKDNSLVAVLEDASVWRYDGSGIYTDYKTVQNGLDCFHPVYNATTANRLATAISFIQNTETLLPTGFPTNFSLNAGSAISATFKWVPLESWWAEWGNIRADASTATTGSGATTSIDYLLYGWTADTTTRNTEGWYSAGAWLNLRFPFPKNSIPSGVTATEMGSLYGGSTSTSLVPYLDMQNMTYSADGKKGFNQGVSSEDLGPISSIDFSLKITYYSDMAFGLIPNKQLLHKEDFKFRCFVIDKFDNVMFQDFVILFNNWWEPVSLPLNGFNIYRGRRPIYQDGFWTDLVIPPKEVKEVTQFRWDKVAMFCIQSTDSYDDAGRYRSASGNDWGTGSFLWDSETMTTLYTTITIDALRFSKPLLTNSGQATGLNNEPDFVQSPDIFLYDSLKNNTLAELEKHKFKNKRYDITTQGQFDIEFGDYFVLEDSDIVDEKYTPTGGSEQDNQILLVAKHIEYEFSKPDSGAGGFERRIMGAKRFI